MALVPLEGYGFFLAQLVTFGYVFAFFGALAVQYKRGLVSKAMLQIPKGVFAIIGGLEGVQLLMMILSSQQLPGVMLPLLMQSILFWQLVWSYTILNKRYSVVQLLGVAGVALGVIIAALPGEGSSLVVSPFWATVFAVSLAGPSLSSILKEKVFNNYQKKHGEALDLFVVNSFGSAFQALVVLLLLPVLCKLQGMQLTSLPSYIGSGVQAVMGNGSGQSAGAAPMLALFYVVFNLLFNVSGLNALRQLGSLVVSLVMSCLVPLTIWAFTFHLPVLGPGSQLTPKFFIGALILMASLFLFNGEQYLPIGKKGKSS